MTKKRLNKWQLEIKKLEDAAHHDIDKVLYETYRDALVKVRKSLKEYEEAIDDLPYYKQVQLGQLRQLENEIVDLLNDAGHRAEEFVATHKSKSLVDGYYQTMYQMDAKLPNPIDFLGLDTNFIRQSVTKPVAGKRFSQRLYEDREQLARVTRSLINSGFIQGQSMDQIANLISAHTESTRKQALRIARTEGGRLRSEAKEYAYQEAVAKNIEFEVMWVSALDSLTRTSHRKLDGQTRSFDGVFKSEDGYEAKGPRLFNVAKEDINCRCTTVIILKDEIQEFNRRDGFGTVFEYEDYQEWYENRVEAINVNA